jgi:hypothetical protein
MACSTGNRIGSIPEVAVKNGLIPNRFAQRCRENHILHGAEPKNNDRLRNGADFAAQTITGRVDQLQYITREDNIGRDNLGNTVNIRLWTTHLRLNAGKLTEDAGKLTEDAETGIYNINAVCNGETEQIQRIILNSSVGQAGVCVQACAGQGTTTRNSQLLQGVVT